MKTEKTKKITEKTKKITEKTKKKITNKTKKIVIIINDIQRAIIGIELHATPEILADIMEETKNYEYKEEIKAFINNVYNKAVTGE